MPLLTIRESHTIVKLRKRIHDNWVFDKLVQLIKVNVGQNGA